MRTDVKETKTGYELEIELPGVKKEDVKAELKDGYLTITASTESKKEEKQDGKYIRKERYSGTTSRSFYVGEDITQEDIKAKFENAYAEDAGSEEGRAAEGRKEELYRYRRLSESLCGSKREEGMRRGCIPVFAEWYYAGGGEQAI